MPATHDSDVLSNQLLLDTPLLITAGFGVPMIVGACSMPERIRVYEGPTAAADAAADAAAGDITSGLAAYVESAMSQLLVPEKIYVGRREPNVAQVYTITIGGASDGDYVGTIGVTDYTFTASGNTDAEIATGLASLIDADASVTASAALNVITVTSATAGVAVDVTASSTGSAVTVVESVANVSLKTELDALKNANDTWFGIAIETRTDQDNIDGLEWAAANGKLFAGQSSNSDAPTSATTDVFSVAKDAGLRGGFLFYRASDSSHAAWKLLTNRLGIDYDERNSIFSFTRLVGETVDDLEPTEKANLRSKNAVLYLTFKGVACAVFGNAPDGTKLDVLITKGLTVARLDEENARLLLDYVNRGEAIGLDDDGILILENAGSSVLLRLEDAGHYIEGSTRIRFKRFSELTPTQKSNREVPYEYGGLLRGGVESLSGVGYATLDAEFLLAKFGE